jgi:polyphenol oxidase
VGDDLQLRRFAFDGDGVTAVVSTRHGGVSAGPYDSLNLGAHVGDDPDAVRENRARLAAALGAGRLTVADQRHTATVAVVDRGLAGRGHDGAADSAAAFPATDAMISNVPGTALAILVADCAPLVFYDPVNRAAGVAHSGRVGTIKGVVPNTVAAMTAAFGSVPKDLLIGIGPAIGAASYEIGPAEAAQVTAAFGPQRAAGAAGDGWAEGAGWAEMTELLRPSRPGHALFDLAGAIRGQLAAAGVPAVNICDLAVDTRCNTDNFFSDRAARPCGRFAAVAVLRA